MSYGILGVSGGVGEQRNFYMYIKRWESPRREGRNHKGRGGSARQRQLKKRQQLLRRTLGQGSPQPAPQGLTKTRFLLEAGFFVGEDG